VASPNGLEFLTLGPLEVRAGESPLELGGRKQRAVLAILLLARGAVVTREQLIDDLWPELPPASAAKSVQVYVSNLRKRLGDATIVTRGSGYALAAPSQALDVERFEALAAEGRHLLATGDAGPAAERLRAALALWRGPALADLMSEPFAEREAVRLEELRLGAIEDRIEAELAFGEHESLVPELGRLVREHPLRERLRRQLMLALYRSGRHADALAAYRDAQRTFRDELGLEPSGELKDLERAILSQDRELAGPSTPTSAAVRRGPQRKTALVVAAAAAALVVVAGAGAWLAFSPGDSSRAAGVSPNSLAVIDPRTNAIADEVRLGGLPGAVAIGEDAVWVANFQDQVVARIDPDARAVSRTYAVGAAPESLAVGAGAVWVGSASRNEIVRVDLRRDRVERIGLPQAQFPSCSNTQLPALQPRFPLPLLVADVVALRESVWFVCPTHAFARVDPVLGTAALVEYTAGLPLAIAHGAGSLWVANLDADTVSEVDDVTGETLAEITAPGQPSGIAVAARSVWVTACAQDAVWRIVLGDRPGSVRSIERIGVGRAPKGIAADGRNVWVANSGDGTVMRIEPATAEVVGTINVGHRPHEIAVGEGFVWVSVQPSAPWRRGCAYP
jgi:YVTN family beta-propeller protein